jgi:hypothetical protein
MPSFDAFHLLLKVALFIHAVGVHQVPKGSDIYGYAKLAILFQTDKSAT